MSEIGNRRILRIFGSFLAFTHLLTAFFWLDPSQNHITFFTDALPVCWPYLRGCEDWARLSVNALFGISFVYCVIAAAAAVLFLIPKYARIAFGLLAAASLMKLGLYQLDYRLSGNFHYMHFWVLAAFFFIPGKSLAIRYLLVGFYLGAGVLKLNREWLSGSAIWENPYLSGGVLKAGCIYVVVLELVLIFGLFARRRWIFWATFAQLVLFHTVSSLIVGYYYPLMLLSFLSLFVLCEYESPGDFKVKTFWKQPALARVFLGLFVLAQLVPFVLGGDRALDGRGRLWALTMFDANVACEYKAVSQFRDPAGNLYPGNLLKQYQLDHRLHCDPNVILADARHRCRAFAKYPEFERIDLSLRSKRKTDAELTEILNIPDFCRKNHYVDIWGRIR